MPNSSHMLHYSFSHFLPLFSFIFTFHAHTSQIVAVHTHSPSSHVDVQTHTFYMCTRAHTFTLGSRLAVPSPVSQSMLDVADSDSCHSSISTGGYARHHAKPRRHYPARVCGSGRVCVHMCLSMHQWFRFIYFMLYSTKMYAVTAFSLLFHKDRQGGLAVRRMVPQKKKVTRLTVSV